MSNEIIRNAKYYDMLNAFQSLNRQSKENKSYKFHDLLELITSANNILLAYRNIKSNKGSKTKGCDGKDIKFFANMSEIEFINYIRNKINNFNPNKVKRVMIPKPNGKKRPLGIPSITDRIIQQCFKQILEPICEAKFYNHSYGFRPGRSTSNAIARFQSLANKNKLHYVVDIDIKGFFDNINHNLLIKQLYNIGIADKRVLTIISKMLKAEIDGEGIPEKGTPQGGILSPLLSNIVLNDLDWWVSNQWETFDTKHEYSVNTLRGNSQSAKYRALKKTNLKEGYIVRYADDFKIFCRTHESAVKWFHAVKLYLKDRLKLDISLDKSKITNMKKKYSNFLGFKFKMVNKGNKYVNISHIDDKKKKEIITRVKKTVYKISKTPTPMNISDYNAYILGVHNYFKFATRVNLDFSEIHFKVMKFMYNRLKRISHGNGLIKPINPDKTYKMIFKNNFKVYHIHGVNLYPMSDIQMTIPRNYTQTTDIYSDTHEEINGWLSQLHILSKIHYVNDKFNLEYFDNRISKYSMQNGKCHVLGKYISAKDVHCHHIIPYELSKDNSFDNLVVVHGDIHKLIHAVNTETINKYLNILKLDKDMMNRLNKLREKCNLNPIKI